MTDEDKTTKTSRRAQRRAKQAEDEAKAAAADERDDEAEADDEADGGPAADADEADDDAASADDDETEVDEAAASADDDEADQKAEAARKRKRAAAGKPVKKKKKKQRSAASTDEIRDRNIRMREAARSRRKKKREHEAAAAQGLDAGEMVDDALARGTHAATTWLQRNFRWVQWVIIVGVAGGIGWQIYSWRQGKALAAASDELVQGVEAELGRVGDEAVADRAGIEDPRASYPTEKARLEAAASAYREAMDVKPGSGTAILAKLGLAGVHFDRGEFDKALTLYREVEGSELAKNDDDVRGRALESIGLALEAKKDQKGALDAFKTLENAQIPGFTELSWYHQARVLHAQGKDDEAKALLKKVQEKVAKAQAGEVVYLRQAAQALLQVIDPTASAGTPALSPAEIEALKQQIVEDPSKLQKMLEDMGKSVPKLPEGPNAPAPAPAAPKPAPEP